MTRIIAGSHGGRRLAVPPGASTRPTTDRVRESVFSRLDHLDVLPGAEVLDLFAGSGALGLEALSRGARHAVLVEKAASAARITRRNVTDLSVDAEVVVADAVTWLRRAAEAHRAFDVVFVDPPYDVDETTLGEVLALLVPVVRPQAVVVVERSSRSPEPAWPDGLSRFGDRRHGETTIWYADPGEPDGDQAEADTAAGQPDESDTPAG